MSKAGIEMLTKCAALEVASSGVRVNAVAPGPTITNLMRYAGYNEEEMSEYKERVKKLCPMQKLICADDVAKAIIFLCSEKARNITGHILRVDGGRSLTTSGYVPWEGYKLMNRRFEPTSKNMMALISKKISEVFYKPKTHPKGHPEWIHDNQTSYWATHMEDAHIKITQDYTKLDSIEENTRSMFEVNGEDDVEKEKVAKKAADKKMALMLSHA